MSEWAGMLSNGWDSICPVKTGGDSLRPSCGIIMNDEEFPYGCQLTGTDVVFFAFSVLTV